MIKKAYMKPAMTMVKIQQTQMLCTVSRTAATGLDEDNLYYNKGTGNMEDAYVKGNSYNVWDDDWSE